MSVADHDPAIERLGSGPQRRYRISCPCGFEGPWRSTYKSADRDGIAHLRRSAEGIA